MHLINIKTYPLQDPSYKNCNPTLFLIDNLTLISYSSSDAYFNINTSNGRSYDLTKLEVPIR